MRASLGVQITLCGVLGCVSARLAAQDAAPVPQLAAAGKQALAAPSANASQKAKLASAGKATQADSVTGEQLRVMQQKLDEGDASAVEQALSVLAQIGGDTAVQSVVTRLRRGLPPQLTEEAIDALVLMNRPLAAPALLELTLHRRVGIRVKAIAAIGALKVKSAQSALLYALDDPSSDVRGAAVEALATAGTTRALPALFTAADRGASGAWKAIGSLATANDLKRIMEHAQAGDVTPLRPALDTLMARTDLPLAAKLRTVQALEKLGSGSARACLVEWLAQENTDNAGRVRKALFASIKKLDGAAQSATPAPAAAVAKNKSGKPGKPAAAAVAEAPAATREPAP